MQICHLKLSKIAQSGHTAVRDADDRTFKCSTVTWRDVTCLPSFLAIKIYFLSEAGDVRGKCMKPAISHQPYRKKLTFFILLKVFSARLSSFFSTFFILLHSRCHKRWVLLKTHLEDWFQSSKFWHSTHVRLAAAFVPLLIIKHIFLYLWRIISLLHRLH